jgi:hypothetical protein
MQHVLLSRNIVEHGTDIASTKRFDIEEWSQASA